MPIASIQFYYEPKILQPLSIFVPQGRFFYIQIDKTILLDASPSSQIRPAIETRLRNNSNTPTLRNAIIHLNICTGIKMKTIIILIQNLLKPLDIPFHRKFVKWIIIVFYSQSYNNKSNSKCL